MRIAGEPQSTLDPAAPFMLKLISSVNESGVHEEALFVLKARKKGSN
jgi:hypothetical protein